MRVIAVMASALLLAVPALAYEEISVPDGGTVTGKVASVSLTGSGSIATLTNGKTVSLGDGVTVSAQ